MDPRALLTALTLDEKISLLAGESFFGTYSIPRLQIPSAKFTDGPNGARGGTIDDGIKAACFPAAVCLAASWDPQLVSKVATALAEETKTKGAVAVLGPTICPHRSPLGGRNFESFSEDPFLAGQLASSYVDSLQKAGIGAVVKHYAANEQETLRRMINVVVSEKALREIYLKPFEIVVKQAKPWVLMTSYNLVNGHHADMNEFLLRKVLRDQWGFKGLVVSDWGGTNSTVESLNAGTDLEMPGPTTKRKLAEVKKAIEKGDIALKTIEDSALGVLEFLQKTGKFENPETPPERAILNPEHSTLIREAAAAGHVLLKNKDNILPLKREKLRSIALLGLAKECLAFGGGSAKVNCHYKITPYEAIEKKLSGHNVEIRYARGAQTFRNLPVLVDDVFNLDGKPGMTMWRYWNRDLSGEPAEVVNLPTGNYRPNFQDSKSREIQASFKLQGDYIPSVGGNHCLGFSALGPSKVFINGEQVFECGNSTDPVAFLLSSNNEEGKRFEFRQGEKYRISIESTARLTDPSRSTPNSFFDGLLSARLGFMPASVFEEDLVPDAVKAASSADVAIVFTGHTPEWETEGLDQSSMSLPARGSQDRLISEVAAVNSNTIVVNSTGVPVLMPWLSSISGLLQAWFGGMEAGNSIADVLFGDANPGGRLPVTIPRSLEDTPCFDNFPGDLELMEVNYKEEVSVGYRYYDKHPEKVLFPFGFGLSYTSFEIGAIQVQSSSLRQGESVHVSVPVKNTGNVRGREVIQVYVAAASESPDRPPKTLAGFARLVLDPGESQDADIVVETESLAFWDTEKLAWRIPKGGYRLIVGRSAVDIVGEKGVVVDEEILYGP